MIWLKDENTGEKLAYFAKPFAEDKNEAQTQDVSLDISPKQGGSQLIVTVNDQWLRQAKYPVTIDPTVVVNSAIDTAMDTYISSLYPLFSYPTSPYLWTGYRDASYGWTRSYVKIPYLPSLAPGAKVLNAYFHANMNLASSGAASIGIYQVTSDWQPSSINWNSQPAYNPTALSTPLSRTTTGDWKFEVTSAVQGWYNGTSQDYGFMLRATDETNITNPGRRFDSADATGAGVVTPTLEINYEISPYGLEPFWGYAGMVNVHTGNLVLSATDVTLPGKGIPISVTRTYRDH